MPLREALLPEFWNAGVVTLTKNLKVSLPVSSFLVILAYRQAFLKYLSVA